MVRHTTIVPNRSSKLAESSAEETSTDEEENPTESRKEEPEKNELSDEELDPTPEEPKRRKQKFIFERKHSNYPIFWDGPVITPYGVEKLYGLIICVNDGVCYILTQRGIITHRPKFLKSTHKLVGAWLLFKLNSKEQIVGTPDYIKWPPLHTRVFDDVYGGFQHLLIYDFVDVLSPDQVRSKFLGHIINTVNLRRKNGTLWKQANVEYTIHCEFDYGMFKYNAHVVKFFGSVPCYSDLPRVLSMIDEQDDKPTYIGEHFKEAFYTEQEWDNILENRRHAADQKLEDALKKRADYKLLRGISAAKQNVVKERADETSSKPKSSSTTTYASSSEPAAKVEKVDHPPIKPAFGIAMPAIRSAKTAKAKKSDEPTNSDDSKKAILITYSIHGHAYNLAKRYLEEGHRVILHCVEPRNTQNIRKLVAEYGKEVCLPVCGHLQDDDFVERIILTGIKKFGRIDTVFHFASSNCQVKPLNQDENLSYMFDVNVKPLQLIVKHLMQHQRNTKFVKLIGVGPMVQQGALKEECYIGIRSCMEYLAATLENTKNSSTFPFKTALLTFDEQDETRINTPEFRQTLCTKFMNTESRMSAF